RSTARAPHVSRVNPRRRPGQAVTRSGKPMHDPPRRSLEQMSQTSTTESATGSGHRMTVPWERMRSLRRRLVQTLVALAPLVLLAAGVHPALAVLPAVYPLFILIRRGIRRLLKGVTRTGLAGEHG